MRHFIFVIILSLSGAEVRAEHLQVSDIQNTTLNALWSNLIQISPEIAGGSSLGNAITNAVEVLLNYLSPQIKSLPAYRGQFSANCSVFFDQNIEQADCDLDMSGNTMTVGDSKRIPELCCPELCCSTRS